MKKILTILSAFALIFTFYSSIANATIKVKGYTIKKGPSAGIYVNSYYKTSPNNTKYDNYSTKGNYNPYTGKIGTKSPYRY